MEKASKALIMATGVILGVMLLSLMLYIFRQGAKVTKSYDERQISRQLELYNSNFEYYNKSNNTIMDIISLANLAFDVNMDSNYDKLNTVQVEISIGKEKKFFYIPNIYCPKCYEPRCQKCSESSSVDFKNNKCKCCGNIIFTERNKIVSKGGKIISIYDLVNLTLEELSIEITDIKIKEDEGYYSFSVNKDDKLSLTKLRDGKTIYKYLFEVEEPSNFGYHEENMKVSRIKLTLYCNPEWGEKK